MDIAGEDSVFVRGVASVRIILVLSGLFGKWCRDGTVRSRVRMCKQDKPEKCDET